MIALLLSFVDQLATPLGMSIASHAATAAALGVIYRDCRKDRAALWAHVKELERRISGA